MAPEHLDPHQQLPAEHAIGNSRSYSAIRHRLRQLGSDVINETATYPGFGQIRQQSNAATGTYNSLQVGLRQQNKHGLSYGIDYTWSHQIDATQTSVDVDNNYPTYNPWNLKYDKGSGCLDRRQMLNINYEYKLPFFAHATGFDA